MLRTTVRTALLFAIAFFCGGAVAEAQPEIAIIQGTAHHYTSPEVYPDGVLWKSGMTWELWGNLYYSKTNAYDVKVGGFNPLIYRGGMTIQPFTLSYAATEQARGNLSINGGSNINTFYANINDLQNSTKMTFSFPEHRISKLTPNSSGVSVTLPFVMQGVISSFASYTASVPPQYSRIVTGRGTATLHYYRRTTSVAAFRRMPDAEIYPGSVNFTFENPPPQQQ